MCSEVRMKMAGGLFYSGTTGAFSIRGGSGEHFAITF